MDIFMFLSLVKKIQHHTKDEQTSAKKDLLHLSQFGLLESVLYHHWDISTAKAMMGVQVIRSAEPCTHILSIINQQA